MRCRAADANFAAVEITLAARHFYAQRAVAADAERDAIMLLLAIDDADRAARQHIQLLPTRQERSEAVALEFRKRLCQSRDHDCRQQVA